MKEKKKVGRKFFYPHPPPKKNLRRGGGGGVAPPPPPPRGAPTPPPPPPPRSPPARSRAMSPTDPARPSPSPPASTPAHLIFSSARCALRLWAYQKFLTAALVRPGSIFAMADQLLPTCLCACGQPQAGGTASLARGSGRWQCLVRPGMRSEGSMIARTGGAFSKGGK